MTSETASSHGISARLIGVVLCLRAARSLLGWNQKVLAERAGVSESAINRLERFDREPRLDTITKIESAFAEAGVEFESRSDGKLELLINPEVIDDMMARITQGASVTSRGRVDTQGNQLQAVEKAPAQSDNMELNQKLPVTNKLSRGGDTHKAAEEVGAKLNEPASTSKPTSKSKKRRSNRRQ